MTTDEVRRVNVDNIDTLLSRPLVALAMSAEQKQWAHAQRDFWQNADEEELTRLLSYYERRTKP